MRLVPVYLRADHASIRQPDVGQPFELPPTSLTVVFLEAPMLAELRPRRDHFNIGQLPDKFKPHDRILRHPLRHLTLATSCSHVRPLADLARAVRGPGGGLHSA
jgi:hypothetical protein